MLPEARRLQQAIVQSRRDWIGEMRMETEILHQANLARRTGFLNALASQLTEHITIGIITRAQTSLLSEFIKV